MQKIIYVNEVMGLPGVWYDLHNQNKILYNEFMIKMLALGHLQDETDLFTHDPDMIDLLLDTSGFIKNEDKYYAMKTSRELDVIRSDENFHKLLEEYNQKLTKPYKLSYKDVPNYRVPSMVVLTWDCGSESILFTD